MLHTSIADVAVQRSSRKVVSEVKGTMRLSLIGSLVSLCDSGVD